MNQRRKPTPEELRAKLSPLLMKLAGINSALPAYTKEYIANIVKCRPPGNRNPQPDEADRKSVV